MPPAPHGEPAALPHRTAPGTAAEPASVAVLTGLAQRLVDHAAPLPASLQQRSFVPLAWALKELCYAAWSSEPARATRAAEALAQLASAADTALAHGLPSADAREVQALADWTAGIAEVTRGHMPAAVLRFDSAAAHFAALGRPGPAAQTQVPKIMALAMLGRHAEAAACAEATQRAFVAQGDVRAASKVSLNLGSLHLRHDAYAESARHYRDAARLFARVGDTEHSVMADIGLADALTALGDLTEARRIYTRAQARAEAHRLPVLQALVDESLALLDLARGNYGVALAGFESARRRYETLAMPQHLAIAEKQLADAYLELRLLPEALALYQPALLKFEALGMRDDSAWTLAQRGRAQALLGQTAAADASFASAASLFEQQQSGAGQAAVALARAELALARQGDAAAGLALAEQALRGYAAADLAEGQARAEVLRADALLQAGRQAQAGAAYAAALAAARGAQMLSLQGRCLTGLGLAAQAAGNEPAAQAAFAQAVALFEDQRRALPGDELRSAFLSDHLRPYRELLRHALQAHDAAPSPADRAAAAAAVLAQNEHMRARVLGERLEGRGARADDGATDDTPTQDLRARFNWLSRRAQGLLDDETAASPALVEELRRTEQALMERARRQRLAQAPGHGAGRVESAPSITPRADPPAATAVFAGDADTASATELPAALCAALADGEALLAYGVLDNELFACVVKRDGVTLRRRLAAWPEVLAALRAVRFQIESLSHGATPLAQHAATLLARCQARLGQLHGLLWAPLASELHDCPRLLIVAPGPLAALPFAALFDAGQPPGRQALAQRYLLALAPSARAALHGLRQPAAPAGADSRALVMAESSHLLHAGTEAAQVAAMFPPTRAWIDSEATLGTLRRQAPQADVIHLACHAQFRSDNAAFSALHLHDGALTAELAETLALRPCTVVLSGCETGLADGSQAAGGSGSVGGDEVLGLVRAFLVAGAARVLASLWPVDDAVTLRFMAAFYGALRRGQAPAQALQAAQAEVMRQFPHPFHWAAFVLHGGW